MSEMLDFREAIIEAAKEADRLQAWLSQNDLMSVEHAGPRLDVLESLAACAENRGRVMGLCRAYCIGEGDIIELVEEMKDCDDFDLMAWAVACNCKELQEMLTPWSAQIP